MPDRPAATTASSATLLWLPVGAGSRVAPITSRWWEVASAILERRPALDLFHAALELVQGGEPTVIEMAPAWGVPAAERGVVVTGPVGLRMLGRSRFFRYEVRRWRGGAIPDRAWAVGDPVVLTDDPAVVSRILDAVPEVPPLLWGRRAGGVRDMWNSNSLVSWLLERAGIDAAGIRPPVGGRAPGWAAGIAVATSASA